MSTRRRSCLFFLRLLFLAFNFWITLSRFENLYRASLAKKLDYSCPVVYQQLCLIVIREPRLCWTPFSKIFISREKNWIIPIPCLSTRREKKGRGLKKKLASKGYRDRVWHASNRLSVLELGQRKRSSDGRIPPFLTERANFSKQGKRTDLFVSYNLPAEKPGRTTEIGGPNWLQIGRKTTADHRRCNSF